MTIEKLMEDFEEAVFDAYTSMIYSSLADSEEVDADEIDLNDEGMGQGFQYVYKNFLANWSQKGINFAVNELEKEAEGTAECIVQEETGLIKEKQWIQG